MSTLKSQKPFFAHVDAAVKLAKAIEADAILVLLEKPVTWKRLHKKASPIGPVIVATTSEKIIESGEDTGISFIQVEMPEISAQNQLTQAVLDAVTGDLIMSGSTVVTVYSLSLIHI